MGHRTSWLWDLRQVRSGTVTSLGPHRSEYHIGECILDQWVMVLSVPQMSHSGGVCRVLPSCHHLGHPRGSPKDAEGLHTLSFSSSAHQH